MYRGRETLPQNIKTSVVAHKLTGSAMHGNDKVCPGTNFYSNETFFKVMFNFTRV